jgi:hypothetical protein
MTYVVCDRYDEDPDRTWWNSVPCTYSRSNTIELGNLYLSKCDADAIVNLDDVERTGRKLTVFRLLEVATYITAATIPIAALFFLR